MTVSPNQIIIIIIIIITIIIIIITLRYLAEGVPVG